VSARAYAALTGLVLAGCSQQAAVDRALERMREQPRYEAYRAPPEGTVPRERVLDGVLATGRDRTGRYVAELPATVTDGLLERGRTRFGIFCAACHGAGGWGGSIVAGNMVERRPPSLHDARITALPPGRLYEIVRAGYGRMPGYGGELSVEDRWAVVAYVRAIAGRPVADTAEREDSIRGAELQARP
jgi:mono/diheme cytochrome c family protein